MGLSAAATRPPADVPIGLDTPEPTPSASARPSPRLPLGARVEFFGDSQVTYLLKKDVRPPDLADYIEAIDAGTEGCGILYGRFTLANGERQDHTACRSAPDYWTQRVNEDQPELSVIMTGPWDIYDITFADTGETLVFGTAAWDRNFRISLIQRIDILRGPDRAVALALSTCFRPGLDLDGWWERVGDGRGRHVNDLMIEVADSYPSGVYIVEPPTGFCADPEMALDTSYRADGVHYTAKGRGVVLPDTAASDPRASSGVGVTGRAVNAALTATVNRWHRFLSL